MGYDNDTVDKQLDSREAKLYEELSLARKVEKTLNSPGWKLVIGPIFHKMLLDVTGGFDGVKWHKGKIDKSRKEDSWRYWVGYKQFGIDLIHAVTDFVITIKRKEEELKTIGELRNIPMRTPMTDKDNPYA